MKTQEIIELSVKDLRERIESEKANLLRMKMNHAISPLDDLSQIKKARRNIARMLTVLSQKETNQSK
ncbi:50S ribosomal protein L29 [bioreactor metagenome]|jgi:large subunit ribosomal protein L29|uniref:50S ribosomal protein L29 n=1 Tax=bioreactor metagenome TaxID=1076179 RepID=A0A644UH60_9ZZZZ|nr:50S ribosomal protein L29 [Bacteroidales bacterium]WRQ32617.1 50S ribosomal protein L29 [Bacteroidales bacterium MB20-C3-3]MBP6454381.1 50S ribosomal protein L29 [Bacteroidales bacterium]MBP8677075.1 50S ribosomal protein L29 [Bacteroidales bacterium]MBP9583766.1 50S ribosomal protein L29 [Bacteroidales bacterium]